MISITLSMHYDPSQFFPVNSMEVEVAGMDITKSLPYWAESLTEYDENLQRY